MFTRGFARLFSDAHPLTAEEADAQWGLMSANDGVRIAHLLISYLDERVRNASRWHGAVRDWPKPLSFLWGSGGSGRHHRGARRPPATATARGRHRTPLRRPLPQVEVPDEFTAGALRLLDSSR